MIYINITSPTPKVPSTGWGSYIYYTPGVHERHHELAQAQFEEAQHEELTPCNEDNPNTAAAQQRISTECEHTQPQSTLRKLVSA